MGDADRLMITGLAELSRSSPASITVASVVPTSVPNAPGSFADAGAASAMLKSEASAIVVLSFVIERLTRPK